MSALDLLLSASDPFALFGVERTFDISAAQLEERYAAIRSQAIGLEQADPESAGRALAKLEEGRKVLADPVARGRLLLDLLGGAGDPPSDGLPAKFREKLEAGGGRGLDDAERRRLVAATSYLLRQLGSADNGVVQRERRRQIRQNLNAVAELDRRLSTQR